MNDDKKLLTSSENMDEAVTCVTVVLFSILKTITNEELGTINALKNVTSTILSELQNSISTDNYSKIQKDPMDIIILITGLLFRDKFFTENNCLNEQDCSNGFGLNFQSIKLIMRDHILAGSILCAKHNIDSDEQLFYKLIGNYIDGTDKPVTSRELCSLLCAFMYRNLDTLENVRSDLNPDLYVSKNSDIAVIKA